LPEEGLLVSFGGEAEYELESDVPDEVDDESPASSVEAAAVVETSSCAWTSEHDTAKTTARRRNVIETNRKNNLAEPGWLATILKEYLFGTAKGRAARKAIPWSDACFAFLLIFCLVQHKEPADRPLVETRQWLNTLIKYDTLAVLRCQHYQTMMSTYGPTHHNISRESVRYSADNY
jgi:hypothetical protein